MNTTNLKPGPIILKTTLIHTVTYFLVGLIAYSVFDYSAQLTNPALAALMRPADHPLVQAGVLFQPLRGLIFGFVFFLLREVLFPRKSGWLVIWATLVMIGIVSTFGPAPGSIEGLIYTNPSFSGLNGGMLEVLLQSLLLSLLTHYWVNQPHSTWLNWAAGISFTIALALPTLGLLAQFFA